MKQFALACIMYAEANNETFPASIDKLLEKEFISSGICDNVIFLAPNVKMSALTNPANYPLAICDRFKHNSNKVCVVFADGHVTSITIPQNADEKEIINILNKTYHFPPAVMDSLLKAVSEDK